jgi:hypothetical protein
MYTTKFNVQKFYIYANQIYICFIWSSAQKAIFYINLVLSDLRKSVLIARYETHV